MAKKALLDVLEQTIGKYVLNLDAESLNVALWSGKIELQSLGLNVQAVNAELERQAAVSPNLAIPFRVKSGTFGKFTVDVPWSHLMSRSVVLRASELHITVAPHTPAKFRNAGAASDAHKIEELVQLRQQEIENADSFRLKSKLFVGMSEQDSTFSTRLVRRIIENIEVEISDVLVSLQTQDSSVGVTLASLHVFTTNANGNRAFVDRTANTEASFLHKALEIRGFGLYVDEQSVSSRLASVREDDSDDDGEHHSYVLAPLSFDARLRQADSALCSPADPKYFVQSQLSSLQIALAKSQVDTAYQIAGSILPGSSSVRPLFPEYRPLLGRVTADNAADWWKYLFRSFRRLRGKLFWSEFVRVFQMRKRYVALYKRTHAKQYSWLEPLTTEETVELTTMESDRTVAVEGFMLWRDMADAHISKEAELREAKTVAPKKSMFSSLFSTTAPPKVESQEAEVIPIKLSTQELKELETSIQTNEDENELSKETRLFDANFTLQSLCVNLFSQNTRPLARFGMGKVMTSMCAAVDGSFEFAFRLKSLHVKDLITQDSLASTVLRDRGDSDECAEVFQLSLEKSAIGDQNLRVVLNTIEAVASPLLLKELHRFVNFDSVLSNHKTTNTLLTQSVSGSVDLFYDASEGLALENEEIRQSNQGSATPAATDLALALVDAWKVKTDKKTAVVVDLDLRAPILMFPVSCVNPEATAVLLDLGHLRFRYGVVGQATDGVKWFQENLRCPCPSSAIVVEEGVLSLSNLGFSVGMLECLLDDKLRKSDAAKQIIHPISINVPFAIESGSSVQPRCFASAVIPSISASVASRTLTDCFSVLRTWTVLHEQTFAPEAPQKISEERLEDDRSLWPSMSSERQLELQSQTTEEHFMMIHMGVRLESLLLEMELEGATLEANVNRATASWSKSSDETHESLLTMRSFWVVNRCIYETIEARKLLIHSRLPNLRPGHVATIQDLEQHRQADDLHQLAVVQIALPSEQHTDLVVDAKFSSLTLNWNPHDIKSLAKGLGELQSSITAKEEENLIVPSTSQDLGSSVHSTHSEDKLVRIVLAVDSVELCLFSALDELPLFHLAMTKTDISYQTYDDGSTISASLGNLTVNSPLQMGRTFSSYRMILGLSPGSSESLLKCTYYQGNVAAQHAPTQEDDVEAYGFVQLSPMRLVYLHAQVFALIEYATAGILGAITSHLASSAAHAANELSRAVSSKRFFNVKAQGWEVVVPHAAYLDSSFKLRVGYLKVLYVATADAGSRASLSVDGFELHDESDDSLQEAPIELEIDLVLPGDEVPEDAPQLDKATQFSIKMPKASFRIHNNAYSQLLQMISENIGNSNLYLREETDIQEFHLDQKSAAVTHSGVQIEESPRPTFFRIQIGKMSVVLCTKTLDDPLVSLTATMADIHHHLLPEVDGSTSTISLQNVFCNDLRPSAFARDHRSLVYQRKADENGPPIDLFKLRYECIGTAESSLDLSVGSPRVVFVPDVVSELLSFVATDDARDSRDAVEDRVRGAGVIDPSTSGDLSHDSGEPVEQTFRFKLNTDRCSVILVDLGTDTSVDSPADSLVAESIVLEGAFNAEASMTTNPSTGHWTSMNVQLHGHNMEGYSAFGESLTSALQILEPTTLSAYVKQKEAATFDIRCAVMEPIDLILSMRNFALLDAISNSISACFEDEVSEERVNALDEIEEERILNLASALQEDVTSDDSTLSRGRQSLVSTLSVDTPATMIETSSKTLLQVTAPLISVTFINDLQGLDEPLLRLSSHNLVANGSVSEGQRTHDLIFTAFDFTSHVSVLADFFDSTSGSWKPLLTKPFEVSSKGSRGPNRKSKSSRPATSIDLECFPCHLSFSEQFLMGLASASQMWKVYSSAAELAVIGAPVSSSNIQRGLAANAARRFVASLPYALENCSGLDAKFTIGTSSHEERTCSTGSIEYFRFEPPIGRGKAGKRVYGQDVASNRSLSVLVGGSTVLLSNIDTMLDNSCHYYSLEDGHKVVFRVAEVGRTMVIILSSGVELKNLCCIPLSLSLVVGADIHKLGEIDEVGYSDSESHVRTSQAGRVFRQSRRFACKAQWLRSFWSSWGEKNHAKLDFDVTPKPLEVPSTGLQGRLHIDVAPDRAGVVGRRRHQDFEVTCRAASPTQCDPFACVVTVETVFGVNRVPFLTVVLHPRARICNRLPMSISVRSPMPHLYSQAATEDDGTIHVVASEQDLEIFTPGPSVAFTVKPSDFPVGGMSYSWLQGGWIDLPLINELSMTEPFYCTMPLSANVSGGHSKAMGTTVAFTQDFGTPRSGYTAERGEKEEGSPLSNMFRLGVSCIAVDHTGDVLLETCKPMTQNLRGSQTQRHGMPSLSPLGAFATTRHSGRVSLISSLTETVRLLHLTMEGVEGVRRSQPFSADEISICNGGVDSTRLNWEDGSLSSFSAYRQLVSANESEVHIIPEIIVFNGSKSEPLRVSQSGGLESFVEPGTIAPLRSSVETATRITISCDSMEASTAPIRVDSLSLRLGVLKTVEGVIVGSVAVQTVLGGRDSRYVVKIGEIKVHQSADHDGNRSSLASLLVNDFVRFRVQWTELLLSVYEARPIDSPKHAFVEAAMDQVVEATTPGNFEVSWMKSRSAAEKETEIPTSTAVCTMVLTRFTVDWQRIFKDELTRKPARGSPERSQLSIIIHHIQLKDETVDSKSPIAFDSTTSGSFLDLCVRFNGSVGADLVRVDLFDLRLANSAGTAERFYIDTSEDFVWKFLDLADRILLAAGELAGVDIELSWDEATNEYKVNARDKTSSYIEDATKYTPPSSDLLLNVERAIVSPFTVVVSFKRNPQSSRYAVQKGVQGAQILNYFTRRLKFQIDKAELKFKSYEVRHIRGPPDQILQMLSTVYLSRIRMKLVSIMTAVSFQDWRFVAARDDGDDSYVEGDIIRSAGNLTGKTGNLMFRKTGQGIGKGVQKVTGAIGDGIETASAAIGAKPVGAGVNNVVSGVGDGVAHTISGVGKGAGLVIRGAGKGVGQVFGGVTGGAIQMSKGIGKGVVAGDGKAVVNGFADGVVSVGAGVGNGVESIVTGTAEGVLSVGQGLFSGVKSVGRGIGGAFKGKKLARKLTKKDKT